MKELWERFGSGAEDAPNAPALPDWCFEGEEDGSDNENGDDFEVHGKRDAQDHKTFYDTDERPAKRRRKEHHVKVFL